MHLLRKNHLCQQIVSRPEVPNTLRMCRSTLAIIEIISLKLKLKLKIIYWTL